MMLEDTGLPQPLWSYCLDDLQLKILLYTHIQVGLIGPELGNEAFYGILDRL